jgi:4-hydroxy-4-methyl-2-oxoglutarate aldolase
MKTSARPLPHGAPLELKRWNTPTSFMDANECRTLIPAARGGAGKSLRRVCADFDRAAEQFRANTRTKFSRRGEW